MQDRACRPEQSCKRDNMKKLATIVLGLSLIGMVSPLVAKEKPAGEHKKMTDDQKKVMKEITEKYDANKDGKLDKDERAKISSEDKQKMKDAGIGHGKKDGAEKKAEDSK
jgi:hypothetical protein